MRAHRILTLLLAAALAGCATIKSQDTLAQSTGKDLETHVGGTIFKVKRSRDLPNAFGRADVFGGKVFAGYTELRYQGLADDGRIVLRVTEVETHSTETSMSRYGQSTGSYQSSTDRRGNVSGSLTVNNPPQGSTQILPPNTTQFVFDPAKEKELVISDIRVSFIEFTTQRVRYRLSTQP